MRGAFEIRWFDRGRPPAQKPDPAYPDGRAVDIRKDRKLAACTTPLPYPTGHKNIGTWEVHCLTCGLRVMVTAASRRDDPKSVTVNCLDAGPLQ
jgi:hypothetical protein